MLDLLWEYRYLVIIIIGVLMYALLEWNSFKAKCYALMLQAKRYAKDRVLNSGDEQVEWVIKKAYQCLPKTVTLFISEKLMRKIIRYLYVKLKDYMDDGSINNSIV